ncbi:helix-turn-helix transcriptional regulator [Cupriavidus basilensis]|uniref:helix-turn-helix transcriptional regulator n=1 Tax=Cupriavidus sp. TaxID=1873897 RepID=UPI00045184CF
MLMEVTQDQGAASCVTLASFSVDDLSALLGKIYRGAMEDVPWSKALELIRTRLRANYATLILRSPAIDRTGLMVHAAATGGSLLAGEELYNSYYYALDPFVGLPTDRVVTADERLGERAWCNSAMYQEFLKPYDIRRMLGADIRTDDGVECRFRISRGHGEPDFSEDDKAFFAMLLPHFRCAVDLHSRMGVVESERTLYAGAINRMLVGMAIVDETGAIIRTNTAADEILAEKDGVWMARGSLEVEYATERRNFQRVLRDAIQGHIGARPAVAEAMSLTRPSGKSRLGILIRTIPQSEWSEDNKRKPASVIFIRDPERKSQASHEVVRKLFDFTPAETQLALQLADGLALEEAADELGISKNTARAHLRAIFSKTGVTRQATLVRMLLSSVGALG